MKKIIALVLVAVMAFGMAGCVKVTDGVPREQYEKVVAERDSLKAQLEAMTGQTVEVDDAPKETEAEVEAETKKEEPKPGKFNEEDILSKLNVTEYSYSNKYWNYAFLEIENTSDFDISISADVKFYNEAGELVGAKSAKEDAVESGYPVLMYFMPDEKFDRMEYELSVSEMKYYECVQSDLSYEAAEAKDKVILSVTNNGDEAARFVQAYALFFNGDQPVGFSQGYFTDDDIEIKPGKSISKEMDCREEFDSYKVYLTGRK